MKNDNTHDKHDNRNVHDILHTKIITATKTQMCAVLFQGCPRTARLKSYKNIPNTAHAYIHPYVHTYTSSKIPYFWWKSPNHTPFRFGFFSELPERGASELSRNQDSTLVAVMATGLVLLIESILWTKASTPALGVADVAGEEKGGEVAEGVVNEDASDGPPVSWVMVAMRWGFFSLFGVDLESWRFCLSAARMAPRRFLILWWDFVGVEGAMVGGETEGNKGERRIRWSNAVFFVIFTKASDFGWCVCMYIYGNLFTKYILTKS